MKENLKKIVSRELGLIDQDIDFIQAHAAFARKSSGGGSEVSVPPLPKREFILWPFECVDISQDIAETMVEDILSKNYGIHNIASNIGSLSEDIKNGNIKPFIRFNENKEPVACATLIKINKTDVELGRAACVPHLSGGNGDLILRTFNEWKNNTLFPESEILRAEIRIAKPTKEVPGGQATQAICLNKIGFNPTAMVPMFHHGVPDRQEIFLLSSMIKGKNSQFPDLNKSIPTNIGNENELEMFSIFWNKFFGISPNFIDQDSSQIEPINLEAKISGPIVEIKESETPNNIEEVTNNFFQSNGRFALARISLDLSIEKIISASEILKRCGFRLADFEPIIKNNQLSIDILFGKLSEIGKRLMVLPSFIENEFSHIEEDILTDNSILWRKI